MIGCGAYIWGIRSRVVYFINGMIHSSLFRFMSYSLFYFFNTLTYLFNFLGLRIAKSKEVAEADPEKIGKDSKILEMGFVSCVRGEVILLETAKKTSEEEEAVAAEDPAPEATIPEEEAAIEDPMTPEIEEATTQEAEATEEVEVCIAKIRLSLDDTDTWSAYSRLEVCMDSEFGRVRVQLCVCVEVK